MTTEKIYLVEIRLKDWVAGEKKVFAYEEVLAVDEYFARHVGFNQFVSRLKSEPILRRKWEQSGLSLSDVCVPDAVQLDS